MFDCPLFCPHFLLFPLSSAAYIISICFLLFFIPVFCVIFLFCFSPVSFRHPSFIFSSSVSYFLSSSVIISGFVSFLFFPFLVLPSSAFLFSHSCHFAYKDSCETKQCLQTIIDRTLPNGVTAFGT